MLQLVSIQFSQLYLLVYLDFWELKIIEILKRKKAFSLCVFKIILCEIIFKKLW